jgi:hypothetical protein
MRAERDCRQVKTLKKLSWIWVPERVAAVALKVNMTEERLHEQSWLFQAEDYRNKVLTLTNDLGPTADEDGFVGQKLSMTANRVKNRAICFRSEITEAKATML